jgi:uncharacterized phage protein gp47/JayE
MPIEKTTAAQWADMIGAGILDRNNSSYDIAIGPIPDTMIFPQARVVERLNDRVRKLSLIITYQNPDEFEGDFESDLENIASNEGILRSLGAHASVTEIFSRIAAPSSDLVVQRGYPMGSSPDQSTGETVTFVALEERRLPAASASSYFNLSTQRYELSVPFQAIVTGSSGQVGPNRVTRPLRALNGFDSVTNTSAAVGGRDRESNAELIERLLLAVLGREISTSLGLEKVTRDDFSDVEDVLIVSGSNDLLTRAGEDAGAVDAYIIGDQITENLENLPFLGVGQLIEASFPPVREVLSVQNLAGPSTYIEGSDYEVVLDSTGNENSTRAIDGIRFLTGGPTALPAVGALITLTYSTNELIRSLQTSFAQDDKDTHGRDLLFKEGEEVPVAISANLRLLSGFNATTVRDAVRAAVLAFVNALELGDDVEGSDLQQKVRAISGVDNFIITRLTKTTETSGTDDVAIADNEFPSLADADLVITPI